MDHRPPRGRYRGRRRVPTPPRSRYAAVITTTIVGAGIVALGSGAAVPDLKATATYAAGPIDGPADRGSEADRASRDKQSQQATTLDQGSVDLWQLPVRNYTPSSGFGWRSMGGYSEYHGGFDLACPEGTPIYAPFDGEVILAGWNAGYGNAVMVQHQNGIVTLYGHQARVAVKVGQKVRAGDQLGWSGNTGYSTGPHVHYEVRINGVAIDPYTFMLKRGVDLNRHIEVVNGGVLTK